MCVCVSLTNYFLSFVIFYFYFGFIRISNFDIYPCCVPDASLFQAVNVR